MEEYKIPKGIRPTEEPVIEKGFEIEVPIAEEKEISNKIVGEYVSVPEFMVKVMEITKFRNISLNFENLVPIFKLFGEYEDKLIKITYDEGTKQGIINIKG